MVVVSAPKSESTAPAEADSVVEVVQKIVPYQASDLQMD
jgi:hypothetical protein